MIAVQEDSGLNVFDWAARRVMVTGANGFVGRWLIRALIARGAAVTAVVRRGLAPPQGEGAIHGAALAVGNVADADFVGRTIEESGIDTVFHLAAVNVNRGANIDAQEYFDAHLHGACSVLEAARRGGGSIRVVLASSREVEDCLLPKPSRKMHLYMASKASAELIARAYNETFATPVVVLRSQNIYGGGDTNWERLIPGSIRSLLHGETPVIRGAGSTMLDFVHVDDAVTAYLKAAEAAAHPAVRGQVFRIATGFATQIRDVVRMLADLCGRSNLQSVILDSRKDDRVDTLYIPDREREILHWSSNIRLADGLGSTVAWYAAHFREATTPVARSAP